VAWLDGRLKNTVTWVMIWVFDRNMEFPMVLLTPIHGYCYGVYYEAGVNMGILGAKNRNMKFPMVFADADSWVLIWVYYEPDANMGN